MYYTVLFESSAACGIQEAGDSCIPWLEAKYVRKQRQAWSEEAGDAMGCDGMQSGAWRTWFGSIVKAVCSPLLVTLDPRAFPAEQLDHELMVINFAWPVPFVLPNTLNSLTSRSAF
jgi:hypothetical protein